MSNELQVFHYMEEHEVRTTLIDGIPYFVGKDVAEALGYDNTRDALRKHVDPEDKKPLGNLDESRIATPLNGLPDNAVLINESGVYSLIFGSKLPSAREFKHWVTSEVLPSIRQSGMYVSPELLSRCEELERKVASMEAKLNERYTLSVLGETVMAQAGAISFQEGAGFLTQHGIEIGQNRLYKYCRDNKLLCSRKGRQWNKPTQQAMEAGLFNLEVSGGFRTVTLITPRGLSHLLKMLLREEYPLIVMMEECGND